jgi:hypothetical protein
VVQLVHSMDAMARVWVLTLSLVGAVAACMAPSAEGTPYSGTSRLKRKTREVEPEKKKDSGVLLDDGDVEGEDENEGVPDAGVAAARAPSCQSTEARTCFTCCLDANPAATATEDAYDQCLAACGDSACEARCRTDHAARCASEPECKAHHACLEANGCLVSNECN